MYHGVSMTCMFVSLSHWTELPWVVSFVVAAYILSTSTKPINSQLMFAHFILIGLRSANAQNCGYTLMHQGQELKGPAGGGKWSSSVGAQHIDSSLTHQRPLFFSHLGRGSVILLYCGGGAFSSLKSILFRASEGVWLTGWLRFYNQPFIIMKCSNYKK